MTGAYEQQAGFERLVVARDVVDPLTIVTMTWRESQEAADAWTYGRGYREAKEQSGGQGPSATMEAGRWTSVKQRHAPPCGG